MPSIAADIIFMWPGNNGSIPTGWSRETTLDDRFTKGTAASTTPNVTGGGATHPHGTSTHASGTLSGHSHSGTTADSSGTRTMPFYGYTNALDAGPHTHTYASASQTASGGDSGTSNWNSGSSNPSFFDMIYIKSNGSPSGVPPDAVAYWNTSSVPAGWIQHADSRDRFIMGPGSGQNGGGTGGGSHTHSANGSHTHGGTTAAHEHGDDAQGAGGGTTETTTTGTDNFRVHAGNHKHRHTFDNSGAASISAATGNSSGSQSYEPTFTTLVAIENDGGSALATQYIIGMWLGGLGAIPTGWLLCDGVTSPTPDLRNQFIKCANATSDVTDTGGSAGHTHSAGSGHTHSAGHTHTQTTVPFGTSPGGEGSAITRIMTLIDHGHSTTTTSSSGSTVSTTTPISNEGDTQPAFRTVAYIMLDVLASAAMSSPAVHRAMAAAGFI